MSQYNIPYGKANQTIEIPPEFHTDIIEPKDTPAPPDPMNIVTKALEKTFGNIQFIDKKTKSVAIAISDKTRPVPHEYLLPPLLEKISKSGISNSNVFLIIATGTHVPMKPEEFKLILPPEIIQTYPVISHDCDDINNLIDLGSTSRRTPIMIYRQFYESDFRIAVGNIEPHHFMGFSGGAKSVSIGLTGRNTVNINHSMLDDPHAKIAEYELNPMRQAVDESGQRIGIHLVLNSIMNGNRQIITAVAGQPAEVMRIGIEKSRNLCQKEAPHIYDLVIASVGGYPKDINLYQAQKAISHASVITKDGGVVILVAECAEGIGSTSFEQFMTGITKTEEVMLKFRETGFQIGPHKAFMIAKQAARVRIFLISELSAEQTRKFLINPSVNLQTAFSEAINLLPKNPKIAIMPHATNTIPYLVRDTA